MAEASRALVDEDDMIFALQYENQRYRELLVDGVVLSTDDAAPGLRRIWREKAMKFLYGGDA